MSQSMDTDGEEVHYVLNDTEFLLDTGEIKPESLSDIIYSDGTRAILVNEHGHIIQGETQTVVIQDGDDLNQYYINSENGEILVTDEDATGSQSIDGTEVIQYIDEEGTLTEEPQVIYVNEDGFTIPDSDLSQYQIAETQEGDSFPLKAVKLETQVVDLEELMRQQGEGDATIIGNISDDNGYQYAILKDGKLHIQSYTGEVFPVAPVEDIEEPEPKEKILSDQDILDLSKITGRNLLTGQTVTLHSYIDKLQKKNKVSIATLKDEGSEGGSHRKRKNKNCDGLQGLLNKKLTLGKTTSGKRLVGKIVHVEKKTPPQESSIGEQNMTNNTEESCSQTNHKELRIENTTKSSADDCSDEYADLNGLNGQDISETAHRGKSNSLRDKKKIVIHENAVSKECFDQISRTLSGLMSMDSLKKKLLYKNIIVKVVEKKYVQWIKAYTKNISYSSGCMAADFIVKDGGEVIENWSFVPDENTHKAIFGEANDGKEAEQRQETNKYLETSNITLMITQEKDKERVIRVILNPTNSNTNRCSICYREFRSNLQLRVHVNNVHKSDTNPKLCEICGDKFPDFNSLQEHRKLHVEEGKLFHCLVTGCGKFFLTAARLKRHGAVHHTAVKPFRALECSVCLHRCSSESVLKKHLLRHMSVKAFQCETCRKSFMNPGDLNFHRRVHDPYKIYACEICQRTFSRHSNLQRHIEIHKGSGDTFQCAICGCSYHYMSSLTRHVVQNHIKRPDSEPIEATDEHENEES